MKKEIEIKMYYQNLDVDIIKVALSSVPEYNGYDMSVHDFLLESQEALEMIEDHLETAFVQLLKAEKLKGQARESVIGIRFESFLDFKIYLLNLFISGENILQLFGKLSEVYQLENEPTICYASRVRNIGQGTLDTALYEKKLNDTYKNGIEHTLVKSFIIGLNREIHFALKYKEFSNFSGALVAAAKIEKYISNMKKIRGTSNEYLVYESDVDGIINPRPIPAVSNSIIETKAPCVELDPVTLEKAIDTSESVKNNNERESYIQESNQNCHVKIENTPESDTLLIPPEKVIDNSVLVNNNILDVLDKNTFEENNNLCSNTNTLKKDDFALEMYIELLKRIMTIITIYRIIDVKQNLLKHSSISEINPTLNLMAC